MLVLLIVFLVAAVFVTLYLLSESSACTWKCDSLSGKAVLITGCDFNEIARQLAVLLDKNGVPVFACYSDKTNADHLKYI